MKSHSQYLTWTWNALRKSVGDEYVRRVSVQAIQICSFEFHIRFFFLDIRKIPLHLSRRILMLVSAHPYPAYYWSDSENALPILSLSSPSSGFSNWGLNNASVMLCCRFTISHFLSLSFTHLFWCSVQSSNDTIDSSMSGERAQLVEEAEFSSPQSPEKNTPVEKQQLRSENADESDDGR